MSHSAINTLFAAKYSSIDRWSNCGKLFNGYHMRPEYYFILFDFMDGLSPHPNSIKGLEHFGEHYEICKLEGMSMDDQAKMIIHRINQKSSEGVKVVLLDLGDFESIYKDINCFSLESRKTIAAKTAKSIFDPSQMKEKRYLQQQKYVKGVSCSSIDVEDDAVRSEENKKKAMKEELTQANQREQKNGMQNDSSKQGEDAPSNKQPKDKQKKERNKKGEVQKKNKEEKENHQVHNAPKMKKAGDNPSSNVSQENFDAVNHAVEDELGRLFGDSVTSFSMSAGGKSNNQQPNSPNTTKPCYEKGRKDIEEDQVTEKIPTVSSQAVSSQDENKRHNNTVSSQAASSQDENKRHNKNESGGKEQKTTKTEMTRKDAEERTEDAKRKAIEREVLGVGSASTDHELRYSEYENQRAELVSLRISRFIASIERAIPLLKEKELTYEHYSKLLITFIISDDAQNFMENWSATEPSKSFKIDDKQFVTFKSEAMYIQKFSDTLFSDIWVS